MKKIVLTLSILGLVACQPRVETKYVTKYVEREKYLSCKTEEDFSLDPEKVVQFQQVNLNKHRKKLIYQDCEGKVTKTKILDDARENHTFKLFPKNELAAKKVLDKSAYNRTTCDRTQVNAVKKIVTGIFDGISDALSGDSKKASIEMDLSWSPTMLDTEVDEGINMIDYAFYGECMDGSTEKNCKRKVLEEGTVILTMLYKLKYSEQIIQPEGCMQ